ncbi:hypothetical protein ACIGB8_27925 [Promicromonospora sukumoe]|uniref:hypothetical protein n=1 Tax=Promicromonospora sukumoe TaxID=88382 RepID=UPI0037C67123
MRGFHADPDPRQDLDWASFSILTDPGDGGLHPKLAFDAVSTTYRELARRS